MAGVVVGVDVFLVGAVTAVGMHPVGVGVLADVFQEQQFVQFVQIYLVVGVGVGVAVAEIEAVSMFPDSAPFVDREASVGVGAGVALVGQVACCLDSNYPDRQSWGLAG